MSVHRMRGWRCRLVVLAVSMLLVPGWRGVSLAVDLGTPVLSEPLQQEKFFDTERVTTRGEATQSPGTLEPHFGLSHAAREDVGSTGSPGVRQTTHKIHGEAGGTLTLLDNVSLTAIAKIPLYSHEARFGEFLSSGEGKVTTDLMRNPGNLSWRSELGVNLGKGIDLNLFYDRSMFGRVDKPGVNEQEEKFGTRFIIHFK